MFANEVSMKFLLKYMEMNIEILSETSVGQHLNYIEIFIVFVIFAENSSSNGPGEVEHRR